MKRTARKSKQPTLASLRTAAELTNVQLDDPSERGLIDEGLTALGLSTITKMQDVKVSSKPHQCTVLGTDVVTPCNLHECRWHVDYPWSNNCMVAYAQEHGSGGLSADEISFLLKRDRAAVTKSINGAVAQLRGGAVEQAHESHDLERTFEVVKLPGSCAVCGASTPKPLPPKFEVEGLAYCSQTCMELKPPVLLLLEAKHGVDLEKLLAWAAYKFRTPQAMEQALGVPRQILLSAVERYTDAAGPRTNARFRRPDPGVYHTPLRRRTNKLPKWIERWRSRLETNKRKLLDALGEPRLDLSLVSSDARELLPSL